jgi:alanine racemase
MDAKSTLGKPRLLISCQSLCHNATLIRKRLPSRTRMCAVVKANAYGHGAGIVADALGTADLSLNTSPADAFAVADLDEAAALDNVRQPIIVLRPVENVFLGQHRSRLENAIRHGWILTVCSPAAAGDLARVAQACRQRAAVQIMIDTGMAREGVPPDAVPHLIDAIRSLPALRLVGLATHFARGEEHDHPFNGEQLDRFLRCTDPIAHTTALSIGRHAANSAAIFFAPAAALDMVRPGISLYGIDPSGKPCVDRPLRPVLEWLAPIVAIHDIPAGASVGYGQSWRAASAARIGLVPVGYADGYPRSLSSRGTMIVHRKPVPVVGKVCMDMTCLDLTAVPHAAIGDEATVLDPDPLSPASAYAIAKLADTIPYEILSRIGPRIRRVAIDPVTVPTPPAALSSFQEQ